MGFLFVMGLKMCYNKRIMSQENPHFENEINFFGQTNYRHEQRKFGIKTDDRRRHMYIIGKTGMGKTTMLENMIIQDINNGHGVAYIDPHGDTAERLLEHIPPQRINDVVYFNPSDLRYPISFNVLESVDYDQKHLVASGLMAVFTKIWANLWSARMEYILNNTILALLEVPGNSLLGIMRMLVDKTFRKRIVSRVKDPMIKSFWTEEFANYNDRFRQEAIAPIQNKVGQFLSSSIIRNIVGQTKSSIDLRDVMDSGKILIMNLSKGRIGEDASALLGAMMITKLQLAAMSRVDIPEGQRRDFYLYVDEFQNFSTESFASILSEARKYRLNITLAHQYVAQLSDEVRAAVFGNVGTLVSFRIGAEDADELEKEFTPQFLAPDMVNLPKFAIILKLMIDGMSSNPFSAHTLPPMTEGRHFPENVEKVINVSRERYAQPSDIVEEKIIKWLNPDQVAKEAGSQAAMDEEEEMMRHPEGEHKEQKPEKAANAVCDNCEKPVNIKFKPDEKRNVFCKNCLKKFKDGEIDASKLPKRNLVALESSDKEQEHTAGETVQKQDAKQDDAPPAIPDTSQGDITDEPISEAPASTQLDSAEVVPDVMDSPAPEPDTEILPEEGTAPEPTQDGISLNSVLEQEPVPFTSNKKQRNTRQPLKPGTVVRFDE